MQNTQYNVPNKTTNTKYKKHNAYRLCSSDYMNYFNEADIDQPKQLCILSATRALHPTSIEAELMLQATSSEDSWHEALDQLVSGGMQRNQADACLKERYWRLTRVQNDLYETLTNTIITHRLWRSVMLHCADWEAGSSLLMLL